MFQTFGLFLITAAAELFGSYLLYLWLRQGKSAWLAFPALLSLLLFGWLLTLHPGAAARTYAAYGGVYVLGALLWLWVVEKQPPSLPDIIGVSIILIGVGVIVANR